MVQSPSREAYKPTNSQILRILWNKEFRYRIYKKQPNVAVLSGMNSFHILSTASLRYILILLFQLKK